MPSCREIEPNSPEGQKLFWVACRKGDLENARHFASTSDLINQGNPNWNQYTGLHMASRAGHQQVVEFLLTLPNLDPNCTSLSGASALWVASSRSCPDAVKALVQDNRVFIDQEDSAGITPLWIACYNGNAAVVEVLLACGRYVNVRQGNLASPARIAKERGFSPIAQLLEEHATNPWRTTLRLRNKLQWLV